PARRLTIAMRVGSASALKPLANSSAAPMGRSGAPGAQHGCSRTGKLFIDRDQCINVSPKREWTCPMVALESRGLGERPIPSAVSAAVAEIGRRYLPRGWTDLARQVAIWFGFLLVYQVARGVADRDPTRAFENGLRVVGFEERVGHLFELSLQQIASSSSLLEQAVAWTYWNSEFTVVGLALLWVYLRRHDHFLRFRNWILVANVIGLVGYVLMP